MYKAKDVAAWFLQKASSETKSITNLKLQKLVYYAQAWSLVLDGTPLFEEPIEAWVHGPVIPDLYFELRSYGRNPIPGTALVAQVIVEEESLATLEEVWDVYGGYTAQYLEALTHHEAPWQNVREGLDARQSSNAVITHEAMRAYYASLPQE